MERALLIFCTNCFHSTPSNTRCHPQLFSLAPRYNPFSFLSGFSLPFFFISFLYICAASASWLFPIYSASGNSTLAENRCVSASTHSAAILLSAQIQTLHSPVEREKRLSFFDRIAALTVSQPVFTTGFPSLLCAELKLVCCGCSFSLFR